MRGGEQALLTGAASAPTKGRVYFEDRVCWGFSGPCSLLYLAGLLTLIRYLYMYLSLRVILIVVHIAYMTIWRFVLFIFVYCLLVFVYHSWSHYPFKGAQE